jgi:uncharacterized protein YndB with AHSA1/START domain
VEKAAELEPVRHSVAVRSNIDDVFRLFTEGIAKWWPTDSHSIGQGKVQDVVFEGRVGGRIYERWGDGSQYEWGEITTWEPPNRIVFLWKPNLEDQERTEIEVRFKVQGDSTLVDLEHRGWERIGEIGPRARRDYEVGWPIVLARFENAS